MTTRALSLLVLVLSSIAAAAPGCTRGDDHAHRGGVAASSSSSASAGGGALGGGGAGGAGGTGGLGGGPVTVEIGGGAGGSSASGSGGAGGSGTLGSGGSGGGGAGGAGGAPAGTLPDASVAGSSSGGGPCAIGHVVIGEIRSRGAGGAADEFIALFNATGSAVTLDASWVLEVRGTADADYRAHWTGTGKSVPAWGHFLVAGSGYAQKPAPDQALGIGIVDAASVRLVHAGATVDAVCYAFNATTQAAFDASFTCAGTPASNLPHDNTASPSSNADASIARKPGGTAGNCTDSGDNATDFVARKPATPESSASPPTP